jgi:hypothetical protein
VALQASYALGYNLAIEYLADYEKTWMLDSFRDINSRVLNKDIDWIFLEVRPAAHTEQYTDQYTQQYTQQYKQRYAQQCSQLRRHYRTQYTQGDAHLCAQGSSTCSCSSRVLTVNFLRHAAVASGMLQP